MVATDDGWKTCGVARAVARQFTKALAMVGQLEPLLENDTLVFRVCRPDTLDCNQAAQPFPACEDEFFSHGLQRRVNVRWSANGLPPERRTGYAVVLLTVEKDRIVMEWPLRYRFAGTPVLEAGEGQGILAGVSEVTDDASTIRVVVPRKGGLATRDSAILIGERDLGD